MAGFWFWNCYLFVKKIRLMHTESAALRHLPEDFNGKDSRTMRCQAKVICALWVGMVQSFLSYWLIHSLFQKTQPFFTKEYLTYDCEVEIYSDRDPCSSPASCICCASWKVCGKRGVNARDSSRCENICLLLQKSLLLGETEFDQLCYDASFNQLCYETSKRY